LTGERLTGQAGRRLLVIFNPAAGRMPRRRLTAVIRQLERLGCRVTVRETAARGDAEVFARDADPALFDVVVAAGGDGTINEVVNGLASGGLPLGILPLGTGNVLANEIGLPRDGRRLAAALATSAPRPVWIGEIASAGSGGTPRHFVMMAGIGFDAAVVTRLDEKLKRRVGKLAFVLAILQELLGYRRGQFCVTSDEGKHHAASLVVAKGHFYAGRFVLAPEASLDEPWLHLVLFKRAGRLAAIRYLVAMALGIAHWLPDVEIVRGKSITVTAAQDQPASAPVEGDGDIVASLPVTFRVAERPLQLLHPA
jgi:YegS/Rv2252/BmrU family lipid kinase